MVENPQMEIIIKEYSKNPLCHYEMKDPDISRHEGNFICWDDITVYLKIKDGKILEYSFEVSPRRKRAAMIALLWTRNAIHAYLKDGQEDEFDDLID